jgi:transmembrane sensor
MPLDAANIREEAAQWLARLERGLRDDEGQALREWLNDATNRSCLLSQARIGVSPEALAVLTHLFPNSPELNKTTQRRHLLNVAALSAAAATIVVTAYFAFNARIPWAKGSRATSEPFLRSVYATGADETHRITLPDGSLVALNRGTRLMVMYWPNYRSVTLLQGEARFRVTPASEWPFSVRAGNHFFFYITGSSFDVRILTPETIELTVADGEVKVVHELEPSKNTPAEARLRDNSEPDQTIVGPLEFARFESGLEFVRKLQDSEVRQRIDWRLEPSVR